MNMSMFAFAATSSHVMIGFGVVNLVCVITKTTKRDVVFEWEFMG